MLTQATIQGDAIGRIDLPERFDVMNSARYRIPFVRLLGSTETHSVVLNFSDVTYIDSSGVGTLLAWHKTCQERGKKLVIQNCGTKVMAIFEMLAIDRILPIESRMTA